MRESYITRTVLAMLVALLSVSCSKDGRGGDDAGKADDSLAVNVAVYPSLDALPLMLGNDWGVFDSLGVAVKIHVYRSQLDAEKALADNRVDVAMSDMFRVVWWQWQKKPVKFAFVTRRNIGIVTNKALRITDVRRLDDRMIAISRFSQDDYFCDKVDSMVSGKKGRILRPQINSVELRAKMLESGQLDAAVLGQQQVYKVARRKYEALKVNAGVPDGFAGFAFNVNSCVSRQKRNQMHKFRTAYDIAVNRICRMQDLRDVGETTAAALFLDTKTLESINPRKDFMPTKNASHLFAGKATEWLRDRNAIGEEFRGDTVVVE